MFTIIDLCVSSLRRGHANLLCIVPMLTDDPRRESTAGPDQMEQERAGQDRTGQDPAHRCAAQHSAAQHGAVQHGSHHDPGGRIVQHSSVRMEVWLLTLAPVSFWLLCLRSLIGGTD
jgi:hypothetical protein